MDAVPSPPEANEAGIPTEPAGPETVVVATIPPPYPQHPRRRLGLRARVTTAFALGALALSGALAGIGYVAVRSSIVNQQVDSLRHQALANAVLLRGELLGHRSRRSRYCSPRSTPVPTPSRWSSARTVGTDRSGRCLPVSSRSCSKPGSCSAAPRPSSSSSCKGRSELLVGVPIPAQDIKATDDDRVFRDLRSVGSRPHAAHAFRGALDRRPHHNRRRGHSRAAGRPRARCGRSRRPPAPRSPSPEGASTRGSRAPTSPTSPLSPPPSTTWWTSCKSA